MAKIMHLVDPRMMEQMSAPINPIHHSINALDRDMQSILNRTDLSDDEKVQKYNQVLQRYLEYHNHLRSPAPVDPAPTVVNNYQNEVISTVPKTLKRKAIALLERVQRHPDLSWTDDGEMIYQGEVFPGSHIVDLINDMIRPRKSFEPHGWQVFAHALQQTNIPQDLVGNAQRWDWMKKQSVTPEEETEEVYTEEIEDDKSTERPSRSLTRTPVQRRSRRKSAGKRYLKWET